jgi:lauroyl/myristoyl acyltransferase
MAAQAPIIPVFAVRVGPAKVRIIIEDAIEVEGGLASVGTGVPHPALIQLAKLIESYVARYPDQWLAFHPAWVEDQERD